MSARSRIRLSVFLALALACIACTSAAAADKAPNSERGIVQSVSATELVLKALDGSIVTVAIDERTRVRIDGRPASILEVRPGYVAVVSFRGASGRPAQEVEAFTTSSNTAVPFAGVVRSVSATGLVLTARGGKVTLADQTVARVFVDGRLSTLGAVRAGFTVVVRSRADELRDLYAFSPKGGRLYDGVVVSATRSRIVVQARNAGRVPFAVTARTAVFVDGKPGSIRMVEVGDVVVVRTGLLRQVWAFSVR